MLLKQGDVVGKRYRITGKLLGEGGSSEVWLPLVVPLRLKKVSSCTSLFLSPQVFPAEDVEAQNAEVRSQWSVCATIDSALTLRGLVHRLL